MSFGVFVGAGASIGCVPCVSGIIIRRLLHDTFLNFASIVDEVSWADEGVLFSADFEDCEVDAGGASGDDGEFGAAVSPVENFNSFGLQFSDDVFHGFQQPGGVAEVASFDATDEWFPAGGFGHGAECGDDTALHTFKDGALLAEGQRWLLLIDGGINGEWDGLQSEFGGGAADAVAADEAGGGVSGVVGGAGSGSGIAMGNDDFVSVILQFASACHGDEQVFSPERVGGMYDDRPGRGLSRGGGLRELQSVFAIHMRLLLSLPGHNRNLRRLLRCCR